MIIILTIFTIEDRITQPSTTIVHAQVNYTTLPLLSPDNLTAITTNAVCQTMENIVWNYQQNIFDLAEPNWSRGSQTTVYSKTSLQTSLAKVKQMLNWRRHWYLMQTRKRTKLQLTDRQMPHKHPRWEWSIEVDSNSRLLASGNRVRQVGRGEEWDEKRGDKETG